MFFEVPNLELIFQINADSVTSNLVYFLVGEPDKDESRLMTAKEASDTITHLLETKSNSVREAIRFFVKYGLSSWMEQVTLCESLEEYQEAFGWLFGEIEDILEVKGIRNEHLGVRFKLKATKKAQGLEKLMTQDAFTLQEYAKAVGREMTSTDYRSARMKVAKKYKEVKGTEPHRKLTYTKRADGSRSHKYEFVYQASDIAILKDVLAS
jgi:hypothetical protein